MIDWFLPYAEYIVMKDLLLKVVCHVLLWFFVDAGCGGHLPDDVLVWRSVV